MASAPYGVAKAADPMLPIDSLAVALCRADAWIEFNNQWLLHFTPFEIAMEKNKKLRYLCSCGDGCGYDGESYRQGG